MIMFIEVPVPVDNRLFLVTSVKMAKGLSADEKRERLLDFFRETVSSISYQTPNQRFINQTNLQKEFYQVSFCCHSKDASAHSEI
jgi:hypothetical protein